MLIAGLGGVGAGWGPQIERFAAEHFVVLPDHRGTGQTTRAADGYTIAQHAADMASLLAQFDIGPAHIVGSSTGGAIAQSMALDHAPQVRSVTTASSFARPDAFMQNQFALKTSWLLWVTCRRPIAAPRCFCFRRATPAKIRSAYERSCRVY